MEKMLIQKTEEKIKEILEQDINASNVENLYKLSKIRHMAKEDECMNYGNYSGYGNYEPSNCRWITRAEQNRNQRKTKKRA